MHKEWLTHILKMNNMFSGICASIPGVYCFRARRCGCRLIAIGRILDDKEAYVWWCIVPGDLSEQHPTIVCSRFSKNQIKCRCQFIVASKMVCELALEKQATLHVDASVANGIWLRRSCGKLKHLTTRHLWVWGALVDRGSIYRRYLARPIVQMPYP